MKVNPWIAATIGLFVVAGCGGVSGVVYGHPSATGAAEPGVSTYLCSGSTTDMLLQWRDSSGSLSGTFNYANLTGTPPGEQVSTDSGNVSGTVDGSALTLNFSGFLSSLAVYGNLSGQQPMPCSSAWLAAAGMAVLIRGLFDGE